MTPYHQQPANHPRQESPGLPHLSRDGYIRLAYQTFRQLEMTCLYSGMDDDRPVTSGLGASATSITGFTEWVSHGIPAITIGWDWKLAGTDGKPCLLQTGIPGRNLMFIDQHGQDLGTEQTTTILIDWIKTFDWQTETMSNLSC